MKFEFVEYNKTITDMDLIEDLVHVANSLKLDSLSMAEYDKHGKYNSSTIGRRFSTWNNALSIANLRPRNRFYSEEEMFANLYNVWIKKGRQPTRREIDDKKVSSITSSVYCTKFGTWAKALKAFIAFINEDESRSDFNTSQETQKLTAKRASRDVSLKLRFMVMARDNFKCVLCGASPATDPSIILHIDHIIPYSKGGETTMENLQTLCSKCNLGKGNLI